MSLVSDALPTADDSVTDEGPTAPEHDRDIPVVEVDDETDDEINNDVVAVGTVFDNVDAAIAWLDAVDTADDPMSQFIRAQAAADQPEDDVSDETAADTSGADDAGDERPGSGDDEVASPEVPELLIYAEVVSSTGIDPDHVPDDVRDALAVPDAAASAAENDLVEVAAGERTGQDSSGADDVEDTDDVDEQPAAVTT